MRCGGRQRKGSKSQKFTVSDLTTERFQTVLSSISDGVFAVDKEWRITCFNSSAERTTGIKREDAIGCRCCDVFRSNICKTACALKYTMETGNPVVNLAVEIENAQGKRVPVSISTALLRDKRGRVIGGVETFRDLAMMKRLLVESGDAYLSEEMDSNEPRLKHILDILPTIAQSESTVLVVGETGTGKGVLAKTIHERSGRRDGPFVTVNCGALPDTLLESELFGYKAGAFTGAAKDKPGRFDAAESGTLFLDEIGDMPLALQVKLLRVLQERAYERLGDVRTIDTNVRIVAATHRDLGKLVEDERFRKDLYYRINVIRLEMPPLRERMFDLAVLIERFLRRFSISSGKEVAGISHDALALLSKHDFPGNIRELMNILEHAHVLCTGGRIEVADLPDWLPLKTGTVASDTRAGLPAVEAQYIRGVLARNQWSRIKAARELGMHRTTLTRKIRSLGIKLPGVDGRALRKKEEKNPGA